jgi:sulfatase maturation enzyme AslB (radical SAM superfamily)
MQNKHKLSEVVKTLYEPIYTSGGIKSNGKIIGIYHSLKNEIWILDENEKPESYINLNDQFELSIQYKPDTAQMYIKLTEACNFACPGCTTSVDKIHPSKAKNLDIETLEIYLESFLKSANEKQMTSVKIKWAGGEPLLLKAYKLIVEAQSVLNKLKTKYTKMKIQQVILTNGVFIDEQKARFFHQNNFSLSVSLWGTDKTQDLARKPRNKLETYEVIIKNISILETNKVDYSINYVLTPSNASNFEKFIESVWDINSSNFIGKNWTDKHPITLFIAFFRPQEKINPYVANIMYTKMLKGLRKGFSKIKELIEEDIPIQPLNIIDYINLTGIAPYTCGSGINYVAVGPEGAGACHEELFSLKSNINEIKNGKNIIDLVNKMHEKDLPFYNGMNYFGKKNFNYLMLHGGLGCPRIRKSENKNWKNKLGSTLNFYSAFIDELLALECLRLINKEKQFIISATSKDPLTEGSMGKKP